MNNDAGTCLTPMGTDLMPYGLNLLVLYSGLKGSFLATQVFTFHQEPTIKFI